ncbi:unnamed protein product, partial [Sphacelaria rigidula]
MLQIAWRRHRSKRKASQADEVALSMPSRRCDNLERNIVLGSDDNQHSRPADQSAPDSRRLRQLGNDRAGATAWEGWASPASALETEMVRGSGEADEAVDVSGADRRPWTAAAANKLDPIMLPSPIPQAAARPPAGMMAVRVRIGGEEKSLMTPIVVTETDRTGQGDMSESGKGGDPKVLTASTTKQQGASVLDKDPEITQDNATGGAIPVGRQETPVPNTHFPQSKSSSFSSEEGPTVVPEMAVEVATARFEADRLPMTIPLAAELSSDPLKTSSPLPPPPAVNVARRGSSPHVRPENANPVSAASDNKGDFHRTQVVKAVDNFMEDSQVYLGCSICDVKYLVEAVEARLPTSAKGQPIPEVLYLCTTCGGALRQGEDGRWRRRRRPSSAPAASRRRRNEVTDRSAYRQNCLGASDSNPQRESADEGGGRARYPGGGQEHQHGTVDTVDHASRGERVVKLRYARCASRIQNAYQDFRHRQYLRDWALGVV